MKRIELVDLSQDDVKARILAKLKKQALLVSSPGSIFEIIREDGWRISENDFFIAIASLVIEEKIEAQCQWTKIGSLGGGRFKDGLEIEKIKIKD